MLHTIERERLGPFSEAAISHMENLADTKPHPELRIAYKDNHILVGTSEKTLQAIPVHLLIAASKIREIQSMLTYVPNFESRSLPVSKDNLVARGKNGWESRFKI